MDRGGGERGLTFIEIMVVLLLMGLLAAAALPYMHHKYKRIQEVELKRKLTMMRDAIDRYHDLALLGQIEPWDLDWMMYPEDLEMLVEGVEVKPALDQEPIVVRFLREIPIDPMTGEASWDCRGYDDDPDDFSSSCDTLYDVASQSSELATDGSYYNEW